MLVVSVEFLHRTVRAAGTDDTAITGLAGAVEWPPSPMRLYSAFVAADGTGDRAAMTGGNVGLDLLEGEPVIHAEPVTDQEASANRTLVRRGGPVGVPGALVNVIQARFVAADERSTGTVQDYPARRAVVVRPGARLSLHDPRAVYLWPEVVPTGAELRALRLRAARVGYLGCADSPVRVQVDTAMPEVRSLPVWQPDATAGDAEVSVAYPGVLDALDAAFGAWTAGQPRRRAWVPTRVVTYRSPLAPPVEPEEPPAIWLRFERAVAGRLVVAVADALRGAVLGRVEQIVGGPDNVPGALHGHGDRRDPHVRWLPLPHVGVDHADGRIRGACIALPAGTDPEIVDLTRRAVSAVPALAKPDVFSAGRVDLFDGTTRPWSTTPWRWTKPSTVWRTAFPAVHERYGKGPVGLDEVSTWCVYAGMPAPVEVRVSRVPLLRNAVDLPPLLTRRKDEPVRPYSHVELRFTAPIRGPVAIGRGRHFGLGLLAPADEPGEVEARAS